MYVLVHHSIQDPRRFWSLADTLAPSVPPHLKLHHTIPSRDGTRATCVWEAASVEAVRAFLEPKVGAISTNAYAEAENREGLGRPSRPAERDATRTALELYEAFNDRDFARAARRFAPDAETVAVAIGVVHRGPEGILQHLQGWANAFPDGRVTEISAVVGGVDRVAVEFVGRGTQTGTLALPSGEIPATSRPVELRLCGFFELRDGMIARYREYFDPASLVAQLGLTQPIGRLPEPMPARR